MTDIRFERMVGQHGRNMQRMGNFLFRSPFRIHFYFDCLRVETVLELNSPSIPLKYQTT